GSADGRDGRHEWRPSPETPPARRQSRRALRAAARGAAPPSPGAPPLRRRVAPAASGNRATASRSAGRSTGEAARDRGAAAAGPAPAAGRRARRQAWTLRLIVVGFAHVFGDLLGGDVPA